MGGAIVLATAAALESGWLLLGSLAAVTVVWVVFLPRLAVPVLLVGLVLQEGIARNLERVAPTLGTALRSLDEIVLVAAAVRVVALLASGDRDWFRPRDWIWAGLFVACGIASSLLHWSGVAPAALGLALACKFFGFLLLALSIPWQPLDGQRLVRALAWMAPVLLATGLLGFLFPRFTADHFAALEGDVEFTRGGIVPFMVPFVSPGLFGWAMAVTSLAAFAILVERRARTYVIPLLAGAAGVILSLRRRPLLGIPIAIVAGLTQLPARRRVYAVFATATVVALLAWFGGDLVRVTIADTIQHYFDPIARETTGRGAMFATSLVIAGRAFPFGEGFGRFGGFASQRYYSALYDEFGLSTMYGLSPDAPYYITDTYWPHLLGEVGVFGTLAMAAMLLTVWYRTRRAYRNESVSPAARLTALCASLLLVEGVVESLGGPVFEVSLQAFVIALPVGIALRLTQTPAVASGAPDARRPRRDSAGKR